MKRIACLVLTSALLIGCQSEVALDFDQVSLSENDLENCVQVACPEITVSYLQAKGPQTASSVINNVMENTVIKAMDIVEDGATPKSVEAAMEQFVDAYRLHLSEFPDMSAVYNAEVNIEAVHISDTLLSFSVNQYLYTGGAHGLGRLYFLNLDPVTGNVLKPADMIGDKPGFLKLAEQAFRTRYNIPQGASINENGFWFDNDEFSIPNTIGFNGHEFILVYNPYDIASYADGSFDLRIPYNQAKPFLTVEIP